VFIFSKNYRVPVLVAFLAEEGMSFMEKRERRGNVIAKIA